MQPTPLADGQPQAHRSTPDSASTPSSQAGTRVDPAATLWRVLLHPALLIAASIVVLLLLLAAFAIVQLPDQLREEPAASARWLLITAAEYGALGPFMRGIGLFDAYHSLLLRLSLAFLTLILAAHLVDLIGSALAYRHIRNHLCSAPSESPHTRAAARTIYRRRFAGEMHGSAAQSLLVEFLQQHFGAVESCELAGAQPEDTTPDGAPGGAGAPHTHFRNLASRHALSYYLRPLLPLGLLSTVAVVWAFLIAGWELHSPTLAPGVTYRAPSRDIEMAYAVEKGDGDAENAALVSVEIGDRAVTPASGADFRARLGSSRITGRAGAPALLVRVANGEPLLAEPGESEMTDRVGVILPSPGSEESLLVPDLAWGLRIVRRTDAAPEDALSDVSPYYVELYRGAELLPQQRIEVDAAQHVTVAAGGDALELELVPLPGIDVTVRNMPGTWLLWVSVALSAAGIAGMVAAPALVVVQIGPWPVDRSVLTLYASRLEDLEAVATALAAYEPLSPAQAEPASSTVDEPESAAANG